MDNRNTLRQIAFLFSRESMIIDLLLDAADCGKGRTKLPPGSKLMELYRTIAAEPAAIAAGRHIYDGYLQDSAPKLRQERCDETLDTILEIKSRLEIEGLPVPRLVAGGSSPFRIHAENSAVTDCNSL